ncbi:MAG TPA: TetR/AcrR family transcriptional regulator [Bacillota bacterium]|nr:TetR/AcrR family transcriptional regulator [Bacillota bacterium]
MSDASVFGVDLGPLPSPASTRRAKRRERTRQALLQAGERLLGSQGYHATTVAQVAQAADIGVGTFYLYFRDKDDLAETILRDGLQALKQRLEARMPDVLSERRIAVLLAEILAAAKTRPDLFQMAFTTRGTLSLTLEAQSWLAGQIADALRAGALGAGPNDLLLTGRLVAGMVTQAIAWWCDHPEPGPEAMTTRILALLRAGGEVS